MVLLKDIIADISVEEIRGELDKEISDIQFDSRKIREGQLFVAQKGTQTDGHQFVDMAIANGAAAIMCEQLPARLKEGVTYLRVANSQQALALALAEFFGHPAKSLQVVGITGTNGKSTTVSLLHDLFSALGCKSGLISTIQYKVGTTVLPASHTTPDARQLQALFARMRDEGCEYCFMEVSSHALMQQRTAGIPFAMAVFTNISHDHLDYHGTFAAYIRAKKRLFDGLSPQAIALINTDDRNARVMVQNCAATVKTYALKRMADYRARLLENTFEGLLLEIDGQEVWCRLMGSFNAYNLLAAYAVAREAGLEAQEVLTHLSSIKGVAGRFEVIRSGPKQITAIVDYAHTPDALENVLKTIADINQHSHQLIVVMGCGGNRDRAKRPKMGKIAAEWADQLIITSDNPRNEDPHAIMQEVLEGVPQKQRSKVLMIENRRAAIETACRLAGDRDIVLVAGKGHENYQEIRGVKHPFDDREVLRETFKKFEI
ncbi:MAG: UDP-N-acetylmuramoyl-L-alanyl-D-glutamate--2,6-diaminopimelate ligase [Bacteroidetes bacterium]|nr:MAG: UDP-N-acetylmuramoyl-L-alanyl-D-glutamate--2,6-diaminopimelate ligase [Bacteroidota bacterium]